MSSSSFSMRLGEIQDSLFNDSDVPLARQTEHLKAVAEMLRFLHKAAQARHQELIEEQRQLLVDLATAKAGGNLSSAAIDKIVSEMQAFIESPMPLQTVEGTRSEVSAMGVTSASSQTEINVADTGSADFATFLPMGEADDIQLHVPMPRFMQQQQVSCDRVPRNVQVDMSGIIFLRLSL
jgi:hypothetical protein